MTDIKLAFDDFEGFIAGVLRDRDQRISEITGHSALGKMMFDEPGGPEEFAGFVGDADLHAIMQAKQVEKFYDVYLTMVGIVLHFEKHREDGDEWDDCHVVEFCNMLGETLAFVRSMSEGKVGAKMGQGTAEEAIEAVERMLRSHRDEDAS